MKIWRDILDSITPFYLKYNQESLKYNIIQTYSFSFESIVIPFDASSIESRM